MAVGRVKGKCDYCGRPAVIGVKVTKDGGRWWRKPWAMRRRIRGCQAHVDKALDTLNILAESFGVLHGRRTTTVEMASSSVQEHEAMLSKVEDALSAIRAEKDST